MIGIVLRTIVLSGVVSAPEVDDQRLARQIDTLFAERVASGEFSGALQVAHGSEVVYQGASGLASRAFHAPNRVDTKFNLGSMNKMFTAVSIAQLAQRGKLTFGDTVGKHLSDWPNAAVRDRVTIHHLLTHTSGMGSYFNDQYQKAAKEQFRAVRDYRVLYAEEPLEFEPGSKWSYSNSGFMLLGEIIEAVSGMDYFDYVRENVTGALGMNDTACYEMDRDTENLALGYTTEGARALPEGEKWNNLYLHVVKGGPAGGCFSTVPDLVKFAAGLREGKLLDPRFTDEMTAGKVAPNPAKPDTRYGYGIGVRQFGSERVVGHGGGFPGINGQLDIYWNSNYVVAVLSNYDPPAASSLADAIRGMILPE